MPRRLSGPHLVVGSSLIAQGLLVVSGPLAVRLLGLDGRGEVAFLFAAVLLIAQIGPFGIPQAWSYAIASDLTGGAALLRSYGLRYAVRGVGFGIVGAAGVGLLAMASGNPLTRPVGELAAAAVGIAVLMLAVLAASIAEGGGRFRQLAALRGLPNIVYTGGLVTLAILSATGRSHAGVVLVLAVYFAGWGLVTALVLAVQTRDGDREREVPSTGRLRGFGRMMMAAATAPIDNLGVDQLLVGVLLGHAGLGAYTVALAFSTPVWVILAAIGSLTVATIARLGDPAAQWAFARRSLVRGTAIAAAMVLLIELVVAPATRLAFGSEASLAVGPTRVLIVAGLLLGVRRLVGSMLQGLGRPGAASVSEFAGFGVMLVAMATLAPLWGLHGACMAMLLAGATAAAGTVFALRRATARTGGRASSRLR